MNTSIIEFINPYNLNFNPPEIVTSPDYLVLLPDGQAILAPQNATLESLIMDVAKGTNVSRITEDAGATQVAFRSKSPTRQGYRGWEFQGRLTHYSEVYQLGKKGVTKQFWKNGNFNYEQEFAATRIENQKQVFETLTKGCEIYRVDFADKMSQCRGTSFLFIFDSGRLFHFDCFDYQGDFFQQIFYRCEGDGFLTGHISQKSPAYDYDVQLEEFNLWWAPSSECRLAANRRGDALDAQLYFSERQPYSETVRSGSVSRTYRRFQI